jgi:hypothetical protein
MTYTRKPLTCACGAAFRTLRQIVEHQQAAHDVGERPYAPAVRDDVIAYDEDAFKRADL